MPITVTGILFISTIVCGIIALIVYHVKRIRLYRHAAKFPGPSTLPIIGNAHYFVGDTTDILNKLTELTEAYPSPFRVWLGNRLFFAVTEPEQLKAVFLSPKTIEKDDLYTFARPWLGTGLFTAPAEALVVYYTYVPRIEEIIHEGHSFPRTFCLAPSHHSYHPRICAIPAILITASKWRLHRKLISPTFNSRLLESFVDIFAEQSEVMVTQMEKEVMGKEFDMFNYVSLCTLDIICETAMGVSMKAQLHEYTRYIHCAKKVFEIIYMRMFKVWLHPDFLFNFTQMSKNQRGYIEYLHSVTNDVIQKKKHTYQSVSHLEKENSQEKSSTKKVFLDILMELSNDGTKLTDKELREEVDTMMIAGNDTTASVSSFVSYMLANHPDIQEKVYQELCEIYGDDVSSHEPVKNEDLNRMEYLERVIKETMRLFPVGPILVRKVAEDLNIGEYTIPQGASVVMGIMKVQRCEKYWPDPLKFDPDRFLPEVAASRHPYCYVPFSAGPRNCLGIRYAMMAMKTLFATVLRRYVLKKDKFVTVESIKLKAEVLLKPVEPLMIRIEKREVKEVGNGHARDLPDNHTIYS